MTLKSFVAALGAFGSRRPFRPFGIELVTGVRYLIKHPELIEIRGELIAFLDPKRRYRIFDCNSVCQFFDPPIE